MVQEFSLSEGLALLKEDYEKEQKKSVVIVHDQEGHLLAPCTNKRARILLERGQASVLRYVPFTIQLTKDTGDGFDGEFTLRKGTVQVCFSNIGQNRTEFMLKNALSLAKKHQKVLFVSSVVHEEVLNELILQEVGNEELSFTEHFHARSVAQVDMGMVEEWVETFEPDVLIIDHWREPFVPRKLAKENNVAIWYGISTKQRLERMPQISDIRVHGVLEQESSFIISLYGNQVAILKNRFGSTLERKATHQKNICFSVE